MQSQESQPSDPLQDKVGLHGDFWTRFLLGLLRIFPAWFCAGMARPIAILFYASASRQRAAILSNLQVLHPRLGRASLWWAGSQVFIQFALTYIDRLCHLHLGHPLHWDFNDCEAIEARLAAPGGVLLFTAHSGNFDIGATCFARSFPRTIHIVRVPERTTALQEFRRDELAQLERANPGVRIHYSADEWSLGIDLCALLRSGEVVALQGDRAVSSSPLIFATHDGITFSLPRGPLVLAELARVPCYAVFLTRKSRCHYQLQASPAFHDGNPRTKVDEIAQAWVSTLCPFVRQHWQQWYVLEPMLRSAP